VTEAEGRLFTLADTPFRGATGRGVRVAIVDSGVAAAHPHVGSVVGGVRILPEGEDDDYADRLGHGTAVTAAIREKVPDAELLVVRIFDRELVTTAGILARGVDWATAAGARIINVSLGTTNPAHAERFARAVQLAEGGGAVVVAAATSDARPVWPGALPGVIGVEAVWDGPRDALRVESRPNGGLLVRASAFPRPIPGVPTERNLQGVSFAVANATGFLARLCEGRPSAGTLAQLRDALLSA
jgi:subtilisin family serine protease